MRKIIQNTGFILCLFISIMSCKKADNDINILVADEPVLPSQSYNYLDVKWSSLFSDFDKTQLLNPNDQNLSEIINPSITNPGTTLGRVLFYDKKLSLNNAISCSSCHHQSNGFADPRSSSIGFEGRLTPRNSMAIVNSGLNQGMFWDSREFSVKSMTLNPIQNHIEMGMENLDFLEKKLQRYSYYGPLFQKAFGSTEITKEKISNALAQFVCSLISTNSKYDQGTLNKFANFNGLELLGKDLFFSSKAKCSTCHDGPNFSIANSTSSNDYIDTKGTANIGLDINYKDNGFGEGQFKIPSLRNIALTAPYMHDGRFNSLREVINHYNSNIKPHRKLDSKFMHSGQAIKLNLSQIEVDALIAFLNTLTDEEFRTNPKFSDPFKN
jgi:cytochrome c peroxidase